MAKRGVLSPETETPRSRDKAGVALQRTLCSKIIKAEQRPKFTAPSPAIADVSKSMRKVTSKDFQQHAIDQSMVHECRSKDQKCYAYSNYDWPLHMQCEVDWP